MFTALNHVGSGSISPKIRCPRSVRFTPDSAQIADTAALRFRATSDQNALQQFGERSGCQGARLIRVSISVRSAAKSIGLVRSVSAPLSSTLRLVSASP